MPVNMCCFGCNQQFLGYDEEDGSFYYTSNEESPLRKAVYKIDMKGKKLKLSQQVGTNTPLFSVTSIGVFKLENLFM